MKRISLTGLERIKLEGIIGAQRVSDISSLSVLYNLREKIRLNDEERRTLAPRRLPDGRELFDRTAVEQMPERIIDLEDFEAARLKEVFEGWSEWTVDDWKWVEPLSKKLGSLD